jgi:hypothetical protein
MAIGLYAGLVFQCNHRVKASMFNYGVEEVIFIAIGVTLRVHGFRNHVSSKVGGVAIIKFNDIFPCIEDRINIGGTGRVAISVSFPRGYMALFEDAAEREEANLSTDEGVISLGCDLYLKGREIGVEVARVIMVVIRGQILSGEVILTSWPSEDIPNGGIKLGAQAGVGRTVGFFVGKVTKRRSACEGAVALENLRGEGRTDVSGWSEVATEGHFVIGEAGGIITKHDPVIPAKFADMADVSSVAGHNGLGGLTVGLINVIDSARTDISFQFDAVVP